MKNKVVILDDDQFMLDRLVSLFEEHSDYLVIPLNDSRGAAEIIEAEQPELVLIDLYMPHLSGFDVGYLLKSNPKTQDIPIMFMSSDTSKENAKCAFFLGAIDLIEKPFKPSELIQKAKTSVKLCELKRMVQQFLKGTSYGY